MSASEAASTGVCTVCFLFDERAELRDFERLCFRAPECLWDRNAVQVPLHGLARCDARPPTLVNRTVTRYLWSDRAEPSPAERSLSRKRVRLDKNPLWTTTFGTALFSQVLVK